MARVQIFKVQFFASNGIDAVAGDILDIFIETEDIVTPAHPLSFINDGIEVELNGVPLVSDNGYSWLSMDPADYSIQSYNPQVCAGTSLVTFQWLAFGWPYAYYYSEENHFSCAVNPPTCDLIVVGVPAVIPASAINAADGSISVFATSSLPIQYKIGSDFIYGDGTAQSDGLFSGLIPGQHRIFLRDSANCRANVLVTVIVDNTYGTRFRMEYDDLNGNVSRIDIAKRGYAGPVDEICGYGDLPLNVQMTLEGIENKFYPIASIVATLNLLSNTDAKFLEIFTNDPNLYRAIFYKNLGTVIPSYDALAANPLDGWLQKPEGGTFAWTIDSTPSVGPIAVGSSQRLYTLLPPIPIVDFDLEYDVDAIGTFGVLTFQFYKNTTLLQQDQVLLGTGNFTGSLTFSLNDVPTELRVHLSRGAISGNTRITAINSIAIIIPEQSNFFEHLLTTKVLKQQYQEDFKAPPYLASFKAICGLSDLKMYYLIQDDGQKYYGLTKVIKLIAHCLSLLRLDLPIRVGVNLYAIAMSQEDYDDPLDLAYVDFERFYLATTKPTLDFVLKSILDSFGARIVQWEGYWNVTRVEEMVDAYDYRTFDKNGEYVSHGTFEPVKDLGFPAQNRDLIFVNADQGLEIRPSYGTLKVRYELGLKPNIIKNGEFRLKSQYYNLGTSQGYSLSINKEGFTLVNAGYSIDEGFEQIDDNNVAYKLTSYILDALGSGNGGEAYIVSEAIDILMGTNNGLRINFRYKISSSYTYINLFLLEYFKVNVPYTKVRAIITFTNVVDTYYLTNDGRWTDQENYLTFFISEVDQYVESEVSALQPPGGASGGSFQIKLFLPFPYYTQFEDSLDLAAFPTYSGGEQVLPSGYRTELRTIVTVGPGTFSNFYYFELQETTDPENLDGFQVIEPDDYDAVDNPRKWVRVGYASSGDVAINNPKLTFTTCIDRIKVSFLTDGKEPTSTVLRSVAGEAGNLDVLEKPLILGSYSSLITTDVNFGIDLGAFYPGSGGLTAVTTNILAAYLIYTGYYRDADGIGYELWKRDGITESDKLHGITLKELSAQYKRSSKLIRGSFMSRGSFFGFLNVLKNINDNNTIYLPMGLSLNDKKCRYSGEMIELKNVFDPAQNNSGSAFTKGFKQSAVR